MNLAVILLLFAYSMDTNLSSKTTHVVSIDAGSNADTAFRWACTQFPQDKLVFVQGIATEKALFPTEVKRSQEEEDAVNNAITQKFLDICKKNSVRPLLYDLLLQ